MTDPWTNVGDPTDGNTTLRFADKKHPLDCFYGKGPEGRYIFLFRAKSEVDVAKNVPGFSGFSVSFGTDPKGRTQLTLTLMNPEEREIFRYLCADLLGATRAFSPAKEKEVFDTIIARLRRWRKMLSGGRSELLSTSEQLGLYGELLVLRDIFFRNAEYLTALAAWQGPSGAEQDFAMGNWLVEVKSQLTSADRILNISSADQLDLVSGKIAIIHQIIAPVEGREEAYLTLKELEKSIRNEIMATDPTADDLFSARMLEVGYVPDPAYDKQKFMLSERTCYEVTEAFPKISASKIGPGLEKVRYCVRLEDCAPFKIDEEFIVSEVFGDG